MLLEAVEAAGNGTMLWLFASCLRMFYPCFTPPPALSPFHLAVGGSVCNTGTCDLLLTSTDLAHDEATCGCEERYHVDSTFIVSEDIYTMLWTVCNAVDPVVWPEFVLLSVVPSFSVFRSLWVVSAPKGVI